MIKRFWVISILLLVSILYASSAFSQIEDANENFTGTVAGETHPFVEWDKREENSPTLTNLNDGLLGDNIDPHTGALSFRHVDISIPGNSDLDVELSRSLVPGYAYHSSVEAEFGDWSYDVPRIQVVTAQAKPWTGARCHNPSSTFEKIQRSFKTYSWEPGAVNYTHPVEYSEGLKLEVPGQGGQQVLLINTEKSAIYPASAKFVTEDHWYLKCTTANDGGDGFIAVSPNGDQYRFDHYIDRKYRSLGSVSFGGGSPILNLPEPDDEGTFLPRVKSMLMATQVTDVNGNWVKYDYDSSGRLTKIYSNDDREISLSYASNSQIVQSATANGRSWHYGYELKSVGNFHLQEGANNKSILKTITQPDQQSWSLNLENMFIRPNPGRSCGLSSASLSLTHPYGVEGTFDISEKPHRRGISHWTYKNPQCLGVPVNPPPNVIYNPTGTPTTFNYTTTANLDHDPMEVVSVTKKVLHHTDQSDAIWTYEYEQDVEAAQRNSDGHPIADSQADPTNWTRVTDPLGHKTTYYHYWTEQITAGYGGRLARQEIHSSTGGLLETKTYEYVETGARNFSYIPNDYGAGVDPAPFHTILGQANKPIAMAVSKTVTHRDGDIYTSQSLHNTDLNSALYSYGNLIEIQSYSSASWSSAPRITTTTYEHNASKWILGLPKTVTQNGLQIVTNNYDQTNGLLESSNRYGELTSYTYHTAVAFRGRPKYITDNLGRRTELWNWKRGTPQYIKRPDGVPVRQFVDDNGWLERYIDAKYYTTLYTRDNMGRLTLTNPHGAWTNTSIAYDFSGGGAVQTITKGQAKTTITYDGMLRPVLEQSQALDTGWESFTNTAYDGLGRVTFKSQPSHQDDESKGTNFTYDGLGRIFDETENFGPHAKTRHRYADRHRYIVYDPSNAATVYYSFGYDGPGGKDYRAIYTSGGQYTDIGRDIHGKITSVTQRGTTNGYSVSENQLYYYNAQQRLCRHYTPEQGGTRYQYDGAGQVTAYIKGTGNSGCGNIGDNDRTVRMEYDLLGRLKTTNFSDTTPDIHRTYDNNGNVTAVNRGGINWAYAYNTLDMIDSEHLTVDNESFDLDYVYTAEGYLRLKVLPSGRMVYTTSDGLGRIRHRYTPGETWYATNTQYHPNSAFKYMYYWGSGYNMRQDLNDRLLPQRLHSSHAAMDLNYSYDARGKITSINDVAVPSNSRSYDYDALGRLTSATGPFGANGAQASASYTYDALGNLRVKTEGSRTVTLNYNALNRLSSSVDSGATGTRSLSYDSRGNVTRLGSLYMGYDISDQPVSISGTANGTGSANGNYWYDGNLKRVKSVVNGQTNYNVYDISGKLVHVQTGTDETDYIDGPLGPLARVKNDVVTWIHPDHLGSAQAGTSAGTSSNPGGIVWREQYTPFGAEVQGVAANDNQAGFTGHIKDKATGLNYMQARYYDPVIGRFLSIDPVDFMQTGDPRYFNRYVYAANDPVNYVDANGECFGPVALACGAGVAAVAGAAAAGAAVGVVVEGVVIGIEGGNPFDVGANKGRYTVAGAIGAVSGGVGGTAVKGAIGLGLKSTSKVRAGAIAGTTAGATAEAGTQIAQDGAVTDLGAVGKSAVLGGLTGGAAGATQAQFQKAGSAALNKSSTYTAGQNGSGFTALPPTNSGATAGAVAGTGINVISSAAQKVSCTTQEQGC